MCIRGKPSYRPPSAEQIERAAILCCTDLRNDETKARDLGICRRTLARWKKRPGFQAAYDLFWEELQARIIAGQRAERERWLADYHAARRVSQKRG